MTVSAKNRRPFFVTDHNWVNANRRVLHRRRFHLHTSFKLCYFINFTKIGIQVIMRIYQNSPIGTNYTSLLAFYTSIVIFSLWYLCIDNQTFVLGAIWHILCWCASKLIKTKRTKRKQNNLSCPLLTIFHIKPITQCNCILLLLIAFLVICMTLVNDIRPYSSKIMDVQEWEYSGVF